MKTYVVTGATGNTGKPITLGLLAAGHQVRIIGRSAEKAKELTDKGAVFYQGSLTDAQFMTQVLTGADAAYLLIPPNWVAEDFTAYQVAHIHAYTQAIRNSKLPYAVTLSSIGAHLPEGAGVVQGLEKMEKALNAVEGLHELHLRASYFMENVLGQVGAVKHMGAMGSPVPADMPLPMVATKDIAAVALQRLLNLDFAGSSFTYILGPREVTYNEVARVMGAAIGKPELAYYTVSFDDFNQALQGMGAGASLISRMSEFVQALVAGKVLEQAQRTPANTTPTDITEFAHTFKYVYEMNN